MKPMRTRWAVAALVATVSCVPALAARDPGFAMSEQERHQALERAGLDPSAIVDPIAVSDDLRELAGSVAGEGTVRDRLARLQAHLFDPKAYVFDYETRRTLTAVEAYEAKSGNCVSFTNLFIALGRALDIPVYASVAFTERNEEEFDDLVVLNSHIVATYTDLRGVLVFDFERRRQSLPVGYRPVNDAWLTAAYHNNLGVERLLAGDLDGAQLLLEVATALAPRFEDALTNLAVVYRRQGDIAAAIDTHLLALLVEPHDRAVRENLNAIYALLARDGETATGLLGQGDRELMEGRPGSALRFYRRAAREAPDNADPLVRAARAQVVKGRVGGAKRSLRKALELEPGHPEATRLLAGLERDL
jgi:tetratricopeptide (TPR) repeat protein